MRETLEEVFIGRQPICDRSLRVKGYELLYRTGAVGAANVVDGDAASATVALNALVQIGLDRLVGCQDGFVNITRQFLLERHYRAFPAERVVLELLEDVEPDAEVLAEMREASRLGFRLALDDFIWRPELEPLVRCAAIVKVEVAKLDAAERLRHVQELKKHDVKVLAEKVETQEEFQELHRAGYDLFQGYFFCKPQVLRQRGLPSDRLSLVRLMARIQDPTIELEEIEEIVQRDVSLSVKLLRYVNSALYGLPRAIASIHQALVILGLERIKACITLILMTALDDKPRELVVVALIRARFCQLLSELRERRADPRAFTVGLLSVLDALLDVPMESVLENLPLAEDVQVALKAREGELGALLRLAVACERGEWEAIGEIGVEPKDVTESYVASIGWATAGLEAL